MNPDYEKQLEGLIDRHLRQLPELPAPAALVPRVLQRIEEAARRPWYRQSWQHWPMPQRAAFLVMALVFLAALVWLGNLVWKWFGLYELPGQVNAWAGNLSLFWETAQTLGAALKLIIRALATPWLAVILGVGMMMYTGLLFVATACYRVVLQKSFRFFQP